MQPLGVLGPPPASSGRVGRGRGLSRDRALARTALTVSTGLAGVGALLGLVAAAVEGWALLVDPAAVGSEAGAGFPPVEALVGEVHRLALVADVAFVASLLVADGCLLRWAAARRTGLARARSADAGRTWLCLGLGLLGGALGVAALVVARRPDDAVALLGGDLLAAAALAAMAVAGVLLCRILDGPCRLRSRRPASAEAGSDPRQ